MSKTIDEIIVFGHSLGEQDYSYFQSIFDYVDLYHSKTKLTFIYSDYFIDDKNGYRNIMATKLFKGEKNG